ncbi:MAG TPA: hypothetical protein VG032_13000 [Acidimicrobiales bacterium]|nr:hypothetical protein [Acidimicrobiales bacterium]
MLRKMLLIAAAVAMPLGFIAATAGTASAKSVIDTTDGATASCTSSGGTLAFKVGIGLTGGSYVFPTKNKGNQIKVAGVVLTCTSSAVPQGSFTGVASGKIKTANPGETPQQFYACTNLVGVSPMAGGSLAGSLKIKWTAPVGVKFSDKKDTINISTILGGVNMAGDGTFTIPGNPGTGSITGAFAGSDGGASSSTMAATADNEGTLAGDCTQAGGLTTINLGSGTASLQ